jgi:predicted RNA-binding protein with PUA-like domain
MKKYWLMKSEPGTYSIDHLQKERKTLWECIRNYQARNFMVKDMQVGDEVLFYHSNAEPSGIAGRAKVSALAQPDPTQFDKKSEYYDAKATTEKPNWFCVQVQFAEKFKNLLSLDDLRTEKKLQDMLVLKRGQRLSIQPVSETEFLHIVKMSQR